MMYFSLYGYLNERFTRNSDKALGTKAFAAGAIAGTAAAGVTTPLDVIKTRVHSNAVAAPFSGAPREVFGLFIQRYVFYFIFLNRNCVALCTSLFVVIPTCRGLSLSVSHRLCIFSILLLVLFHLRSLIIMFFFFLPLLLPPLLLLTIQ